MVESCLFLLFMGYAAVELTGKHSLGFQSETFGIGSLSHVFPHPCLFSSPQTVQWSCFKKQVRMCVCLCPRLCLFMLYTHVYVCVWPCICDVYAYICSESSCAYARTLHPLLPPPATRVGPPTSSTQPRARQRVWPVSG